MSERVPDATSTEEDRSAPTSGAQPVTSKGGRIELPRGAAQETTMLVSPEEARALIERAQRAAEEEDAEASESPEDELPDIVLPGNRRAEPQDPAAMQTMVVSPEEARALIARLATLEPKTAPAPAIQAPKDLDVVPPAAAPQSAATVQPEAPVQPAGAAEAAKAAPAPATDAEKKAAVPDAHDPTLFLPPGAIPIPTPDQAAAPRIEIVPKVFGPEATLPTAEVPPDEARRMLAEAAASASPADRSEAASADDLLQEADDPTRDPTLFLPPGAIPVPAAVPSSPAPAQTLPKHFGPETVLPTTEVPPEQARAMIAQAEAHTKAPAEPEIKVPSPPAPADEPARLPTEAMPAARPQAGPPPQPAPAASATPPATAPAAPIIPAYEEPAEPGPAPFLPPPDNPFASARMPSVAAEKPAVGEGSPGTSIIGVPSASGFMLRRVMAAPPKPKPEPILQVTQLKKRFGKREVVENVDLEVGAGEVVGLLGRNGAGKTTTFRMIMGMLQPDSGKVLFEHRDITRQPMYARSKRGIGYLAQEPSVFQKMTVEENLIAVLELQINERKVRESKLDELIRKLGLLTVRKARASTLSGGERRRLEIARAMTLDPKIVLFDEPFAGIDPIAVNEIQNILRDLRRGGVGILLTDHNVRDTLNITDRTYIMDEGKIWIHGTSREIVNNPEARRRYLGHDFRYDF